MRKLYEKNELWFALVWIILYVVVAGNVRMNFGDESIYSVLDLLVITIMLTWFIVKNQLREKFGLVRITNCKKYQYFIPFVLLCTVNLWFGVALHYDWIHQTYAVITMALVGYVEEVIFRGFLFKALEKESVTKAIIISAVTFGAGHIVNLLTGQASVDTFLQMGYAIAIGFAFVLVFYKSGSLVPCILAHSVINVTSKFSNQNLSDQTKTIWSGTATIFMLLVAGGYAMYLHKKVQKG